MDYNRLLKIATEFEEMANIEEEHEEEPVTQRIFEEEPVTQRESKWDQPRYLPDVIEKDRFKKLKQFIKNTYRGNYIKGSDRLKRYFGHLIHKASLAPTAPITSKEKNELLFLMLREEAIMDNLSIYDIYASQNTFKLSNEQVQELLWVATRKGHIGTEPSWLD